MTFDEPSAVPREAQAEGRERPAQRKLSYKLQRELDALPELIARLEQELAELRAVASDPAFYQRPHLDVQQSLEDLQEAERAVNAAVDRWAELEEQAAAAARGDAS